MREAWPGGSLACCVTLGKFLDLSEPEDQGVGEGGPRAWLLWATGTVAHRSFLGRPQALGDAVSSSASPRVGAQRTEDITAP